MSDDPDTPMAIPMSAGEARAKAELNHSSGRPRLRILLVEDNRADIFLVEEAIKAHGVPVEVHAVEDGAEAVAVIQRAETDPDAFFPGIVVLDLNLPKKSGAEVLRLMRQSPRFKTLPVIVLTSSDSVRDRTEVARLGADRYFRKPATYDEFLEVGAVLNEMLAEMEGKKGKH
jgi:two-component system, chemotaxis family, response regulator Rcp1